MRSKIGSRNHASRALLGGAAGLLIGVVAARADAQCETLPVHAVPCSADAGTTGHFTSALDNAPFVSKTTLRGAGPGSILEHAGVAGPDSTFTFGGWEFDSFEINWGESLPTSGLGSVARSNVLRDVVAPSPDTPFTLMGPSELTWEARGVKLGRGFFRPSANKFIALPDDGAATQIVPVSETWSLATDSILVPVSVIIGVPEDSGSAAARMQDFSVDYVQTLFDDLWTSHATRSNGPNGSPTSYTGIWDARSVLSAHAEGAFRQANGPLNIVRPDDVFAQCGVQFRVIEVIIVPLPTHLATFEGKSFGVGTCSGSGDGAPCTAGPVGRSGTCFKQECFVTGSDSEGQPLAACSEAERKSRLADIVTRAGEQAPTLRFTPDSGITGMVAGSDGLLGAAPLRVVLNYASVGRSCLSPLERPGFFAPGTNRLLLSLAEGAQDLVLSHELGHALGLEHPDQGPGVGAIDAAYCGGSTAASPGDNRNLMCSGTPNQGTHLHGCQDTPADAKFNCSPDLAEHPKVTSTCSVVRMKAGMVAENSFANLEMTAQAMPQPQPQMLRIAGGASKVVAAAATLHDDGSFECSTAQGAPVALQISAHTLTQPRIDIDQFDWTAPGGSSIGSGTSVNVTAPLGVSLYAAHVTDSRFPGAGDTVRVAVVDTTPPELDAPEVLEATSCGGETVTIPAPAGLHDACSDAASITTSGSVVESNGQVLATPIPIVNGQASLEEGTHIVEWQLADASGNSTTARQTLEVHSCWPAFGHDRRHTRLSSLAGPKRSDLAWHFESGRSYDHDLWDGGRLSKHEHQGGHDDDGRDHHGAWDRHDQGSDHDDGGFHDHRRPATDHDCGRDSTSQVRSSPAVGADGSVYVGLGSAVYALNADGSEKWHVAIHADVASSPAVHNGRLFIGSGSGKLLVLDATTGTELCAPNLHGKLTSSPAVAADGTMYVGSEDHRLYALRNGGCDVAWSFETDGKIHSSPAIDGAGTVYVGSDDRSLYAIAPGGAELFRFRTRGAVDSSPSLGQAKVNGALVPAVFFGSDDENLYAVDADSGEQIWKVDLKASVESSPGFGPDGSIYVGSDGGWLWALGQDGALKWREQIDGQVTASPAIDVSGTVYAAARSGKIVAFDGASGDKLWAFDAHDEVRSSPAIGPSSRLFVSVDDERVLAFGPGGAGPGNDGHHSGSDGHHSGPRCSISSTANSRRADFSALAGLGLVAAFAWRRRRSARD